MSGKEQFFEQFNCVRAQLYEAHLSSIRAARIQRFSMRWQTYTNEKHVLLVKMHTFMHKIMWSHGTITIYLMMTHFLKTAGNYLVGVLRSPPVPQDRMCTLQNNALCLFIALHHSVSCSPKCDSFLSFWTFFQLKCLKTFEAPCMLCE